MSTLLTLPTPFSIATWNVNSLRMRHERVLAWLGEHQPDVLCLQEIKMETNLFPTMEYLQAGYHGVAIGQKSYNGVAILVKTKHGNPSQIQTSFIENTADDQSRILSVLVPHLGIRVFSLYVPNGQSVGSEKFTYKLTWLEKLQSYLKNYPYKDQPMILAGDFNIAPDDRDVYDAELWRDTVICHSSVRESWNNLLGLGFTDVIREQTSESEFYTYWDYRGFSFPKNLGLRIDHILATAELAKTCTRVAVDRQVRKGEQPSDHAPLIAYFGS